MSCVTFYLLACLIVLTTVACSDSKRTLPRSQTVINIGGQCRSRDRNYAGACIAQNLFNGELGCLNLVCAKLGSDGLYKAYNTGKVNDGTPCGRDKRCRMGVCIQEEIGSMKGSWIARAGLLTTQAFSCVVPAAPVLATTTKGPIFARRLSSQKRT